MKGGPWTPGPCFVLTPIILLIITLNFFRLNRSKRSRGRQVSFLIEREVVTSRCHGSKISGSQETEVLQIWHKNDIYQKHVTPIGVICFCIYKVFPVHVCTQEQNSSPYFSSIVWKCKWPSLSRSRNFATMVTWRHTSPLFWEEPLYWQLSKIQRAVYKDEWCTYVVFISREQSG